MMDTAQFIENMFDIKLLDYQKKMITYMDEHDYKIILPRGRTTPYWIQAYLMCMCKALGIKIDSIRN